MQNQFRFRQTKSTSKICENKGYYHFYFLLVFEKGHRAIQSSNTSRKSTPYSTPLETTRGAPPSHWFYFPQPECELQPPWNKKNIFVSFLYYHHVPYKCSICVFDEMLEVSEVYLFIGSTLSTIGLSLLQKCFKHSSWNPRISSVL